jgi:superfamily I DNA/RNA helicase
LGLAILQQSLEAMGRREGFVLLDDEDRLALAQAVVDLKAPGGDKGRAQSSYSRAAKALARRVSDIKQGLRELTQKELGEWQAYQDRLQEYNALDMDDLIYLPQVLLEQDPNLAEKWRRRFDWILVDEFQDINKRQFMFLQGLLSEQDNLLAIGDPDQAIYGFRGASSHYIENFTQYFPQAKVYRLEQSFRCPDNVMALAAQAMARSHGAAKTDSRVMIHEAASEGAEAEWLASTIEEIVGGLRSFSMDSGKASGREGEAGLGDIAILCRSSLVFDALEQALGHHAIPYQKASDEGILRRQPLGEMIKILRNIYYNLDLNADMDFALVQELLDRMRRKVNVMELIEVLSAQRPLDRPEQITKDPFVLEVLRSYASDYEALFVDYALRYPVEDVQLNAEAVSLLTMHAAKGLEFNHVFLPALEHGFVPFELFGDKDESEEERLFYVALTRTKDKLYLSHARTRIYFGRKREQKPSPFLERFSQELVEQHRAPLRPAAESDQLTLF